MNILIDIGHPAHVHLFKHFAHEMEQRNHKLLFTYRNRHTLPDLLSYEGFRCISLGKRYESKHGKLFGLLKFTLLILRNSIRFSPDIFLSHGSMYAAISAYFTRKPHVSFEDTFNFEQINFYKPFTQVILTGNYEHPLKSIKLLRYSGYHELAYLHPNKFTPDKSVLKELGVLENEKYVIIRFVSWVASHDIGQSGITIENKIEAVREFSKYAKVFISSEEDLPVELDNFRYNISLHRMHDAIAFSSLVFGESSTMAEEAAMLGTPSIYLNNNSTYYTKHLENDYGLVLNYTVTAEDQHRAIEKGSELLQQMGLKEQWKNKKEKMLADKIDVTAFLIWFIENYPNSVAIMKENPNYQYTFK